MNDSRYAGHTPGPWTLPHFVDDGHPCDCEYVFGDPICITVCEVRHIPDEFEKRPTLEEAKANARLIADAPALLAENEKLRAELNAATNNLWGKWEIERGKIVGENTRLMFENDELRRQRDALRDAAEAGRELSTYVNTIHWDRRKNEVEWMDGLRERVDSTWELSQRAIEEASDD